MRILGLMMVRNGAEQLSASLDRLGQFCDEVFLIDDRSTDQTSRIARKHPVVKTLFTIPSEVGDGPWLIPECDLLNLLYRMAELAEPDWVIRLDCDEHIEPASDLRALLEREPSTVSGVFFPRISTWNDPAHPDLVPLMGSATATRGLAAWRPVRGLTATQPLHNHRMPGGVAFAGEVVYRKSVVCMHDGWNTLKKRIERAQFYTMRDPEIQWNHGTPYDRGLLFGFGLHEIDRLLAEYQRRREAASIAETTNNCP